MYSAGYFAFNARRGVLILSTASPSNPRSLPTTGIPADIASSTASQKSKVKIQNQDSIGLSEIENGWFIYAVLY
ncbi:hypothetical protein SR1949_41880 [Sphaerospermopsis reniformis]|uniref:Uncharacterized protein n=1 Tax=Sphaerospermopsis reniformis TaxID=531300 RepID=A0A480A2I1_9CYAN|nr:hypothetical protein SR1949_41880 [Sphaerospermopsis reniformis]